MCRAEGDSSSAFHKVSSAPTEGQEGARGSAEELSEGGPPRSPSKRGPPSLSFFKVDEEVLQGFGVYCCCFPSLLVFTLAAGEIPSRIAAGLLEGFWKALVVSHLVAGRGQEKQPGKRKKTPTPCALLFSLFPLDQISDLVYHQSANRPYWLVAGTLGEQNQPSQLGWQGGCHPKRQHPSPHLNKLV